MMDSLTAGNKLPPEYKLYEETTRCLACEVLKEEVAYLRVQNKELTETLTSLLKPQVITAPVIDTNLEAVTPRHTRWSRRKEELERADREAARILRESPVAAKVDEKTEELEKELGITELVAEGEQK